MTTVPLPALADPAEIAAVVGLVVGEKRLLQQRLRP
jgi:hypothetical protein